MEDPVHRPRETRRDRLHPARKIPRAADFDDQVYVIALYGVMNEPEPLALAGFAPGPLQLIHQLR
jgi:hypothetical protein